MTTRTQQVFEQAVALPPTDRARLVDAILDSFIPVDPGVDAAWRDESESRIAAWREGTLASEPVADVMKRINESQSK